MAIFCPICQKDPSSFDTNEDFVKTHDFIDNEDINYVCLYKIVKKRYALLRLVGMNTTGKIYEAIDIPTFRRVAVKELHHCLFEQEVASCIKYIIDREMLIFSSLTHQNIPKIYASFYEDEHRYIVTDFIEGKTLQTYIETTPKELMKIGDILNIGIQLCEVLEYLHNQDPPLLLLNLKPSNIKLTENGSLFLLNFTMAQHFQSVVVTPQAIEPTTGYSSPEQHRYDKTMLTMHTDLYSLGAILHQLLTGVNPIQRLFYFAPINTYNASFPTELTELVMKLTALDMDNRSSNALEVKQILRSIKEDHA